MGRFSVCQPRKNFQLFVANYSRMRILAHARKAWEGFGRKGEIVPVIITAYEDKSYDFVVKTSPVTGLLLKAAGIQKGSGNPKNIVGHITEKQLEEIASYKLPDLNANDVEAAKKIIEGSARQMGIVVDR